MKKELERLIKHATKRQAEVIRNHGDNPEKTKNYFGGVDKGYYNGLLYAYQNVQDLMEETSLLIPAYINEIKWYIQRERENGYWDYRDLTNDEVEYLAEKVLNDDWLSEQRNDKIQCAINEMFEEQEKENDQNG